MYIEICVTINFEPREKKNNQFYFYELFIRGNKNSYFPLRTAFDSKHDEH